MCTVARTCSKKKCCDIYVSTKTWLWFIYGNCYFHAQVCDGIPDCPEGYDESECPELRESIVLVFSTVNKITYACINTTFVMASYIVGSHWTMSMTVTPNVVQGVVLVWVKLYSVLNIALQLVLKNIHTYMECL